MDAKSVAPDDRGLVAHWTFDEGSGTVARDVTGNGHDATLKNVEWVPSPRGYALRFDAKDAAALYGNRASMNLSGDLALAVWVRVDPTVNSGACRLIFGDSGSAVERNFSLYLHSPNVLRFEWTDGRTVAALPASASLLNGTWKHVVVVANSTARHAAMYIDGERVAEMPMPVPITPTVSKERLTGWFNDGFFTGEIDDIRLYSRALSEAEVGGLFVSEADVQVGASPRPLFRSDGATPRAVLSPLRLRNLSKEPRRVDFGGETTTTREILLRPGQEAEVGVGELSLTPLWSKRTDLFLADPAAQAPRVAMAVHRGQVADTHSVVVGFDPVVEPLQVVVHDPWQAKMSPGKTAHVKADVKLALPAEPLRSGTLQVRLVSRETGQEALRREVRSPTAAMPLDLDVRKLPWGAYDLHVSFMDAAGRAVVSTKRLATVLPGGKQQIRVLNNLVSELMDARTRGLLGQPRLEFMNPRAGWVWFSAACACALKLGNDSLLSSEAGRPAAEAMRLLPAGKHVLDVTGTPTDVTVRAIPALVYNVYPSGPQIAAFGQNTWERLCRYTLPNTNMIESHVVDTPEYREWLAQGKMWLANVQAPGLLDDKVWTVETLLDLWLNPGKSTAHAERPGLTLDKLSGMQVDEYFARAKAVCFMPELVRSLAQLSEHPAFAGKLWIPFLAGKFGATGGELLLSTVLGSGWPFSEEVYVGEMPTEAEDSRNIRSSFTSLATAYEKACPGSVRRMIFTSMYAYLPYCTTNRCPQADFRVHLDMQMQVLATEPAFFALWGVQPYRSNYVDEEILNCMAMLLRHYGIEGRTDRFMTDPYELKHVADPDFAEGTAHWQLAPAEDKSITAGKFAGYGELQGRYPVGTMGDTFAIMTRSAKAPNVVSQQLQGLTPGRLYSLKVFTGDHGDLTAGKGRKDQQVLSITVDGAEVQPGGFSYPFQSCRGPKPFTAKDPFWMTYHWLRFRATGPTVILSISDWAKPGEPGSPVGQQTMVNFVEVQPVLGK